jgi:GNAT superfamily N-acetyltransferase
MTDVADLLARAEVALTDLSAAASAAGSVSAVVEGIPCARHPVDHPWATQAKAMSPPRPYALDAAIGWLEEHAPAPGCWTVTTRLRHVADPVFVGRGLTPWLELPVLVLGRADRVRNAPDLPGLELSPAHDVAEFLAVFGADLAPLVPAGILTEPGHHHLVGRIAGEPVACARVREVAGTAYVSGIAVVPSHRGKGVGTAISAAAARVALTARPRAVWLTAVAGPLHRLYGRLGFQQVDVHVQLRRG